MRFIITSIFAFCSLQSVFGTPLQNPSTSTINNNSEPSERYIKIQSPDGTLQIIDRLAQPRTNSLIQRSDVTFHLFTRLSDSTGTHIDLQDFNGDLAGTDFDPALPTYFFIHGWISDHREHLAIPYHILNRDYGSEANVFLVDYNSVSKLFYTHAVGSLSLVGSIVAEAIHKITLANDISIEDITVIGFSLGAHVAGFAGAELKGELKTIIGLDPAGPLFDTASTDGKLDRTDAQYVQVIHTNGGLMGHRGSLGHVDFHPNGGGMNQAGCGSDLFGGCAHDRALVYFHESIKSNIKFVGTRCSSYKDYISGACDGNDLAVMGTLKLNTRVFGDYYLTTASEAPFALGG